MGAHQYKLSMLPRGFAGGEINEDDVWTMEQPPSALLANLRALLPKETSWGEVEEFESDRDWGSDLRIWHDENREGPISGIELRYSPVADDLKVLERFIEAAANFGLVVYATESERVLEPSLDVVMGDLRSSLAFRFVSDPTGAVVKAAEALKKPNKLG